jgi:anti-sigma factor RsiW
VNGFLPPPSEDELQSFVDGEIQPERRSAIEAFLKKSPVHAERVEGWRRQRDIIRAAFAPVEAEPAPPPILLPPPAGRRAFLRLLRSGAGRPSSDLRTATPKPPFWRQSAGAPITFARAGARTLSVGAIFTAGAIAALAGAFFADRLHAPPVTAEVRAPPSLSADEIMAERTIEALVDLKPQDRANAPSAAPEKPVRVANPASLIVPNLSSAGFKLVGMRAAPARIGEPDDDMFCLFYARATEPTVALCIGRDRDGGPPVHFRIAGKFPSNGFGAAISWRQANAIYALAGPLSEIQLRNLANRVSAEIEAFD